MCASNRKPADFDRFPGGLDWDFQGTGKKRQRGKKRGMLEKARTIESLTGLESAWVPRMARQGLGGNQFRFARTGLVSRASTGRENPS